jgi:ubiquinone/menaquinone biosynthesis C-methylase UbiE
VPGPGNTHDAGRPADPVYALGSDPAERGRLRRQSQELGAYSSALLDQVGVGPGWRAIDLGCGPSGVLGLLAERVGPGGRVTGLEINPANVSLARELAQELAQERGLANVEVLQGDARQTGQPSSAFDLVHARTLLINVPDPAGIVAEMVRLTRPGGWVAVMEPDVGLSICYPPNPAWDRVVELFLAVHRVDDADPYVGRRLPSLLREAGLTDVGVEAKSDIYPPGHSRRTIRMDLVRSMRPKILARGLASEQELDALDQAGREHLARPDTLVISNLLVMAWARKPLS